MLDANIVSEIIRSPAGRAAQHVRAAAAPVRVSVIVQLNYATAAPGRDRSGADPRKPSS
jgi:hypothetical protein